MGVARLLAKGWVVFCVFVSAHGLDIALERGSDLPSALKFVAICFFLFGAMGLLFIAGFGASAGGSAQAFVARLRTRPPLPSFDGLVFLAFVVAIFAVQVFVAPSVVGMSPAQAVHLAIFEVVPGQREIATRLASCGVEHTRAYLVSLSSAVAWLLAIIYLASAASRIALTAGLVRLERVRQPSSFRLTFQAALYGTVAIVGIQLLFLGSLYAWLGCGVLNGISGALLTGLAPLMLAYLIVAALVTLKASAPEG